MENDLDSLLELLNDPKFNTACNYASTSVDLRAFISEMRGIYKNITVKECKELYALAFELMQAERNVSDEQTANELINRLRIIEKKAIDGGMLATALGAVKEEKALRLSEGKENVVTAKYVVEFRSDEQLTEPENELNEELGDEKE